MTLYMEANEELGGTNVAVLDDEGEVLVAAVVSATRFERGDLDAGRFLIPQMSWFGLRPCVVPR